MPAADERTITLHVAADERAIKLHVAKINVVLSTLQLVAAIASEIVAQAAEQERASAKEVFPQRVDADGLDQSGDAAR